MKVFSIFFSLMFVNYALLVANTRMIARGSYLGTALTDTAIAILGFSLIRHVAMTDALIAQVGFVAGGVSGAMLGLWLTRKAS